MIYFRVLNENDFRNFIENIMNFFKGGFLKRSFFMGCEYSLKRSYVE